MGFFSKKKEESINVRDAFTVTTHRVKQYNSTSKTVVCVNGVPVCIVDGVGKTLSNIVSYLQGNTTVEINDGAIKKALDEVMGINK